MKIARNRISVFYTILIIAPLLSSRPIVSDKYIVDKKESVVTWKGSMQYVPNYIHIGYVYPSQGELVIEKDQLVGGLVEIDMKSIEYKDKYHPNSPIKHLKSEDFFDVEKFPTATFAITKVALTNDENKNITGKLTIKDITHEVTFPAVVKVSAGIVNANGKLTIDRTKWDIRYGSGKFYKNLADETISDDIELEVKIVARKK